MNIEKIDSGERKGNEATGGGKNDCIILLSAFPFYTYLVLFLLRVIALYKMFVLFFRFGIILYHFTFIASNVLFI